MDKTAGDAYQLMPLSPDHALLSAAKPQNAGKGEVFYDIAHLPVPDEYFTLPLLVDATVSGPAQIRVSSQSMSTAVSLYLEDRNKNKKMEIREGMEYVFGLVPSTGSKAKETARDLANYNASNHVTGKATSHSNSEGSLTWGQPLPVLLKTETPDHPRFVITAAMQTSSEMLSGEIPKRLELLQNWPNPFNNSTIIAYRLPLEGHVRLSVYDILGQQVAVLVDEQQEAGYHQFRWESQGLASGVYLYRLESGGQVRIMRMTLLK